MDLNEIPVLEFFFLCEVPAKSQVTAVLRVQKLEKD